MAKRLFTNNAVTLLNAPITATATILQVMSGHGSMFPTPAGGFDARQTHQNYALVVKLVETPG